MARVLSSGREASIRQHMDGDLAVREWLMRAQMSSPLMDDPGDCPWDTASHTLPQGVGDQGTMLMDLLSEIQNTSPENYETIYILATRVYSVLTEKTGPNRVYLA